jgi:hypothetical protein
MKYTKNAGSIIAAVIPGFVEMPDFLSEGGVVGKDCRYSDPPASWHFLNARSTNVLHFHSARYA